MRNLCLIAVFLIALVGGWNHLSRRPGHRGGSALLQALESSPISVANAQVCLPCSPGCFDPNTGCQSGTTGPACGSGGNDCQVCGAGQVCNAQACCTTLTCASYGANCGTFSNGCGGSITCGSCPAPQTCGGGGVPNQCGGCTPTDCTGRCGTISNGCGGTVSCGSCGSGLQCQAGGFCGCPTGTRFCDPGCFSICP